MMKRYVGGCVGYVSFPPRNRRSVGGCLGFVWSEETVKRYVGGQMGYVSPPGEVRFVGGCLGFVALDAHLDAQLHLLDRPTCGEIQEPVADEEVAA